MSRNGKQISQALAEVRELKKERDKLRKRIATVSAAEKDLGEAYLRIRSILNAFGTPFAPSAEDVWAHTEDRARELAQRVWELGGEA